MRSSNCFIGLLMALTIANCFHTAPAEDTDNPSLLSGTVVRKVELRHNQRAGEQEVVDIVVELCEHASQEKDVTYTPVAQTVSDSRGAFEFILPTLSPDRTYAICLIGDNGSPITVALGTGAERSSWPERPKLYIEPMSFAPSEGRAYRGPRPPVGVSVLFATDRRIDHVNDGTVSTSTPTRDEPSNDLISVSNENDEGGNLHYGRCNVLVRFPDENRPLTSFTTFGMSNHSFLVSETISLAAADMFKAMAGQLGDQHSHDALLFIHGYNSSFAEACRRAGQIAYDLKFDGSILLYSWPSHNSIFGYSADEEMAEWSGPHFTQFLKSVLNQPGLGRLHIIAHSMGNRLLTRTLFAQSLSTKEQSHLGEVVLAAPDVNRMIFDEGMNTHQPQPLRLTLYASGRDEALRLSKLYHGYRRAGETEPNIDVHKGLDSIDATKVDTSLIGHSYFGDIRSVLADIAALISGDIGPDKRFGVESRGDPPNRWWRITP